MRVLINLFNDFTRRKNNMRVLAYIIFILFFCFSCSKGGAISPREAFVKLTNSIENSDVAMFKTIQSKDNIKFFEEAAAALSENNAAQQNYISKRYGVSKDFPADYNSLMEFYLFSEKDGNLIKSLKSGIASIDQNNNKAVITTNASTQVVFVKEGSFWKVDLRSL